MTVATRSVGSGRAAHPASPFSWDARRLGSGVRLRASRRAMKCSRSTASGVGQTGGVAPADVEGMADFAARLIQADDETPVDFLGWSLGGFVAKCSRSKYPKVGEQARARRLDARRAAPRLRVELGPDSSERVPGAHGRECAGPCCMRHSEGSRKAGMASLGRLPHPPAAYVSPTHHRSRKRRGDPTLRRRC